MVPVLGIVPRSDCRGARLLRIVDQISSRTFLPAQFSLFISSSRSRDLCRELFWKRLESDLRRAMLIAAQSHAPANLSILERCDSSASARLAAISRRSLGRSLQPVENEVDTGAIIGARVGTRKKQFFIQESVTKIRPPSLFEISSPSDLCRGRFGILEPAGGNYVSLTLLRNLIVFVPGVVFDRCGNRLGRAAVGMIACWQA